MNDKQMKEYREGVKRTFAQRCSVNLKNINVAFNAGRFESRELAHETADKDISHYIGNSAFSLSDSDLLVISIGGANIAENLSDKPQLNPQFTKGAPDKKITIINFDRSLSSNNTYGKPLKGSQDPSDKDWDDSHMGITLNFQEPNKTIINIPWNFPMAWTGDKGPEGVPYNSNPLLYKQICELISLTLQNKKSVVLMNHTACNALFHLPELKEIIEQNLPYCATGKLAVIGSYYKDLPVIIYSYGFLTNLVKNTSNALDKAKGLGAELWNRGNPVEDPEVHTDKLLGKDVKFKTVSGVGKIFRNLNLIELGRDILSGPVIQKQAPKPFLRVRSKSLGDEAKQGAIQTLASSKTRRHSHTGEFTQAPGNETGEQAKLLRNMGGANSNGSLLS